MPELQALPDRLPQQQRATANAMRSNGEGPLTCRPETRRAQWPRKNRGGISGRAGRGFRWRQYRSYSLIRSSQRASASVDGSSGGALPGRSSMADGSLRRRALGVGYCLLSDAFRLREAIWRRLPEREDALAFSLKGDMTREARPRGRLLYGRRHSAARQDDHARIAVRTVSSSSSALHACVTRISDVLQGHTAIEQVGAERSAERVRCDLR
jgi:hypothetical protein